MQRRRHRGISQKHQPLVAGAVDIASTLSVASCGRCDDFAEECPAAITFNRYSHGFREGDSTLLPFNTPAVGARCPTAAPTTPLHEEFMHRPPPRRERRGNRRGTEDCIAFGPLCHSLRRRACSASACSISPKGSRKVDQRPARWHFEEQHSFILRSLLSCAARAT